MQCWRDYGAWLQSGSKRLELYELADFDVQRIGYSRKIIDAHADEALLDSPNVRFGRTRHHGETFLGKPLAFPASLDRVSQGLSFLTQIHAYSVGARIYVTASYLEPYCRRGSPNRCFPSLWAGFAWRQIQGSWQTPLAEALAAARLLCFWMEEKCLIV